MKEIAKHSNKHCHMFFFTAICTPFPLYYLGNALDCLSRVQPLTCTLCTMTKSTFCNATNHGDSEALQKCLILSAKINHFANQSNYVSFPTEVCKLLAKKVKKVTTKEAAVNFTKFEGIFL